MNVCVLKGLTSGVLPDKVKSGSLLHTIHAVIGEARAIGIV